MITYTVAEFLDTFRLHSADTCIYVFRNGNQVKVYVKTQYADRVYA